MSTEATPTRSSRGASGGVSEYVFRTPLQSFVVREDMIAALQRYLNKGIPPGGFLRAVLAHDLQQACANADAHNIGQLPAYAAYLYNELPHTCHGSYKKVDEWIAKGGLEE